MSETKLDRTVSTAEFLHNNFTAVRRDRTYHGGGVLIAVRKGLVVDEISLEGIDKDCEVMFVRVKLARGNPPLYVGAYYRPPSDNATNTSLDGLRLALDQVLTKVRNSKSTVVLGGDFNCSDICWDTLSTTPENTKPHVCNKLIDIVADSGMTQLQRNPTRQDSLLDLFLTSNPSLVTEMDTIPGISTADEHDTIVVDARLQAYTTKKQPHRIYKWDKADWDRIKEESTTFAERFCSEAVNWDSNTQWKHIEDHMKNVLRHVPHKMSKQRVDQPWLTPDLKRRCKKKHRLYNKWKKAKTKDTSCRQAREAYKKYQQETNHLLQKARYQYINRILDEGLKEDSTKPFWNYIRHQRTEDTGVAPLKQNGQVYSDPRKKANILAEQFKSVFTVDDEEAASTFLFGPSYPPIRDLSISVEGVKKLLKGVNPRKAAGPDQVPCRLLQALHEELAQVFTLLFQKTYEEGSLPDVWKTAWITPIYKKDAKCLAANYRPVSLTCVSCKLLEHILASHIRNHLDEYGILYPGQHGFRKKLSCESQLLVTTHDFLCRLDSKEQVDVAILDFSKAFDVVPHQRLLRKLRLYGIDGPILSWIAGFLDSRTQSVLVDGTRSHSRSVTDGDPVLSGVPQGTVLGPLLFLLYVNDLPSVLDPSTACKLFADDCLVYRSITSISDKVILQQDLDALFDWGRTWGLKFNVSKCSIMHLARLRSPPVRFYTLGGEVICSVSESKYLGVVLSDNYGSSSSQWKAHIDSMVSKASQKLGFLRRNLRGSPYKLRELAYVTLVRSSLEYCGSVWDPTVKGEAEKLERVQKRAARWARGARGIISITALLNDLGWPSLADRRRNQRLCLFYKLLNGHFNISPEEFDLKSPARVTKTSHNKKLQRLSGRDQHSPLWRSTIVRTIPEWNSLPPLTAEADTINSFKCRLTSKP